MEPTEKVTFPYETLAQAEKDRFKKIGGPDQAFRFLVKGFKSIAWRKRADLNTKLAEAAADEAFAEENRPVKPPVVPSTKPQAKPSKPTEKPRSRA